MNLPIEFTERMQRILGEEYAAFEKSYEEIRKYGLRVNTKKISPEEFERIAPFHLTKIPWIPGGYYYQEEDAPARHPFYYAGLYYLQEPSAMTPASVLEVLPGERVLDLCAAPGGKATALGAKLQGEGLLVANDISASRCKALLKNIEVFGIPNSFVTNAVPARLAEQFPEFFDKILVDAPCSGEGMFRKDADTIRAWHPEKPAECAKIQKDIILRAADMLRPGGMMLYSTCTFAVEENEEVIRFLLEQRPDMELMKVPQRKGFSEGLDGLEDCVRLWPHKLGGEGHFLAVLKKHEGTENCPEAREGREGTGNCPEARESREGAGNCPEAREGREGTENCLEARAGRKEPEGECGRKAAKPGKSGRRADGRNKKDARQSGGAGAGAASPDKQQAIILEQFFQNLSWKMEKENLEVRNGQVYYVPSLLPKVTGIPFLRNGLYLGELKKDRFEPSQSFAMALSAEDYRAVLSLNYGDERLNRYLRGETIEVENGEAACETGWQLVCVNGYPLGWGKLVNGLLKNKYHAGWRMK